MKKRGSRVAVLSMIAALALVSACSAAQTADSDLAQLTVVPTRTLRPTFTATIPATDTPVPSPTPLPTYTPTATPAPTDTPLPTATPTLTPMPTNTPIPPTPIPTATATKKPAPKPTAKPTPRPTNTPAPPFTGKIVRGFANCSWSGVEGLVKHSNNSPFPGVAVGVWSSAWEGRVAVSESSGKYSLSLGDLPRGKFQVAVVRLETCGGSAEQPTASSCQRASTVIEVSVTDSCTGTGANQVTVIDFTGS